jgi:transposase-like protein
MTATNDSIIKTDRRGRLRYSLEQKASLVEAYQSSGLSGPRFAALHGVNYQTLASWLHKRKRESSFASSESCSPRRTSLIPAEIENVLESGAGQALEIHLPGGSRLSLTAPSQVRLAAALIRELENPRPC